MSSRRNVLSLFAGCGGFDLGAVEMGYRPVGAFDIDPIAIQHYRLNVADHAYEADLRCGVPEDHRYRGVELVIAGPPCQGFSTAGKRKLEDDRNHLLPLLGRLVARIRPRVVIVENVSGVLAGQHARYWNHLVEDLRTTGYKTHTISCEAARLGMAQLRKRMLLLAWRGAAEPAFTLPVRPSGQLRDALRGVSRLPNHNPKQLQIGSRSRQIAEHISQGQKLSNVRGGDRAVHTWDIPDVFGKASKHEQTILELILRLRRQSRKRDHGDADPVSSARLENALGAPFKAIIGKLISKGYIRRNGEYFDLAHTYNGKFRRLSWDAPSCTVDTRFGDPRYFLHPTQHRGFTVREAARIQGFPDQYIFTGEDKDNFRLIGNAVPPPLAAAATSLALRFQE